MPTHARLPLWDDQSDAQKLESLRAMVMDLYHYQLGEKLAEIIEVMEAHAPADEKEEQDIATIKRLAQKHPNLMNMNCEVGHFTASAIIIDVTSGRILLHFHKWLKRWLQLGGHADYETDFSLVALREAEEESGLSDLAFLPPEKPILPLDYDVHTIPQSKDFPEHLHLDLRYVLTTSYPKALAPQEGESATFNWLTFDEALAMGEAIDDSLKRLIRKAQQVYEDYEDYKKSI